MPVIPRAPEAALTRALIGEFARRKQLARTEAEQRRVDVPDEPPRSLMDFVVRFNPRYRESALHRHMADRIDAALERRCRICDLRRGECLGEGHEYTPLNRLMIFIPPQHGKSELVSINAPARYLAEHPDHYWVAASYAETLAVRNSRHARNLVRSLEFRELYGLALSRASNSVTEWEFEGHRGGFYAVGVGGALTGRTADVLVIDDPVKDRQDADSSTIRENVWDWWKTVARTRLNPDSVVIVVMTRWHHDDLAGRILDGADGELGEGRVEDGGEWTVVELPALAREDDTLGREAGDPLMVPHHNHVSKEAAIEWYDRTRKSIGPRDWSALYQQRPSQDEDAIFPEHWWGAYRWSELPQSYIHVIQFWDTALKDSTRNDYHACVTIGVAGDGVYVLDVWRKRMQFPELIAQARNRRALFAPTHIPFENKAAGLPAVQALREERIGGPEPLTEVEEWDPGTRDKVMRAFAVQPKIAAGQVRLPINEDGTRPDWVRTFLDELSSFPLGAHDDMVDAFTGAMLRSAELLAKWSKVQVAGVGSNVQGWIAPAYVDRDTRRAPTPDLVRRPNPW